MYSNAASDIFTLLFMVVVFIAIVSFCCIDDKPSGNSRNKINRSSSYSGSYSRNNHSECPACGAPHYNGYCEECGYPDINQGWLGENG